MKLSKGLVYVISTKTHFEQNIFKIGFTRCIEKRLKQFNNTRTAEDHYFLCFKHDTINYKELETLVHRNLEPYRLKNELFQLPLCEIEDTINKIVDARFFKHKDTIFDNARFYKLLWSKNIWLITLEDNLQVFMNDAKMIEYIKEWIKPHDSLNLYRFISDDYYKSLLSFLKTNFVAASSVTPKGVGVDSSHTSFLSLMANMSLDSEPEYVDDLTKSLCSLKLPNK